MEAAPAFISLSQSDDIDYQDVDSQDITRPAASNNNHLIRRSSVVSRQSSSSKGLRTSVSKKNVHGRILPFIRRDSSRPFATVESKFFGGNSHPSSISHNLVPDRVDVAREGRATGSTTGWKIYPTDWHPLTQGDKDRRDLSVNSSKPRPEIYWKYGKPHWITPRKSVSKELRSIRDYSDVDHGINSDSGRGYRSRSPLSRTPTPRASEGGGSRRSSFRIDDRFRSLSTNRDYYMSLLSGKGQRKSSGSVDRRRRHSSSSRSLFYGHRSRLDFWREKRVKRTGLGYRGKRRHSSSVFNCDSPRGFKRPRMDRSSSLSTLRRSFNYSGLQGKPRKRIPEYELPPEYWKWVDGCRKRDMEAFRAIEACFQITSSMENEENRDRIEFSTLTIGDDQVFASKDTSQVEEYSKIVAKYPGFVDCPFPLNEPMVRMGVENDEEDDYVIQAIDNDFDLRSNLLRCQC